MEFVGDIARKTGAPSLLAVEAAKTERAGQIGKSSGLFYVPKVVEFAPDAGVLDFERLRDMSTLLELAVSRDARALELTEKAGRALAVVHDQLILPDEMKEPLPAEWMDAPDENVFIHGDFGCTNLCFHAPSGQLVILDWSTAPLMGRTPTFGSRYFDILWSASYVFRAAPSKRVFNWGAEEIARALLRGYVDGFSGQKLNKLKDYRLQISQLHRKYVRSIARKRPPLSSMAYRCSQALMHARLNRFLRNCEL